MIKISSETAEISINIFDRKTSGVRFIRLFKKYEKDIKTCTKYIYSGNLYEDKERFWFFSHIRLFTMAHEAGYTYSCKRSTWMRNPIMINGKRTIPLQKEFMGCTARLIDKAFMQALSLMRNLTKNNMYKVRIEY